jgi:hypothetical protein
VEELTPAFVLASWAAGVAAAAAVVARWRVVGPGYVWLAGGVTLLLGVPAALAGAGAWAWAGAALAGVGIVIGRSPALATGALALSGLAFVVAASLSGPPAAALTGTAALGGITGEMMLGHWFLVDPRLPRWALRRLALAGAAGVALDAAAVAALGAFPWAGTDLVAGLGYVLLAVTTVVLMAAVYAALGERGYSGVMAATGLSYLATLTGIGAVVVGRLLVDGPVLG